MARRDASTKIVNYSQFGGFNDTIEPSKLKPEIATDIQNFRISDTGNLVKKLGCVSVGIPDYPNWDITYAAANDVTPDDAPQNWLKSTPFNLTATVEDDILTMDALGGEEGTYYRDESGGLVFSDTDGVTVRILLKVDAAMVADSNKFSVIIEDGTYKSVFYIYKGKCGVSGDKAYSFDNYSGYQMYFLTLCKGVFRYYVNGICRGNYAEQVQSTNQKVTFGIESAGNAPAKVHIQTIVYEDAKRYVNGFIRGLFHYTTVKGHNELIAQSGELLCRSYNQGVDWEVIYEGLNLNYRPHAAMYLTKMYLVNGYNRMLVYDGTEVKVLGNIEGDWWVDYEASLLPENSNPAWSKMGTFATYEIDPAGKLHIKTEHAIAHFGESDSRINTGVTIEARVKMEDSTTGDKGLNIYARLFSPMSTVGGIYICKTGVKVSPYTKSYTMDTTHDYHIYKIIISQEEVKVYVDNTLVLTGETYVYEPLWGGVGVVMVELDGLEAENGVAEAYVDYVKFGLGCETGFFPLTKYIAVAEDSDIMALAHFKEAPNAVIFSSIVDGEGELVNPDSSYAWLYGTTLELDRDADITGIIHFANCWVIAQRRCLTVVEGYSPVNFRKYELRFNSGEDVGCVAHETLQIKQGLLYGVGENKIWQWRGPGSLLEDITTHRIENTFNAMQKPVTNYFLTTTEEDFGNCTTENLNWTASAEDPTVKGDVVTGDIAILRTGNEEIYPPKSKISSNFIGVFKIMNENLTDYAESNINQTTGYVGIVGGEGAARALSSVRIKYNMAATTPLPTITIQYQDSEGDWQAVNITSGTFTADGTDRTQTFNFTKVDSYGGSIKLNCTMTGVAASEIKIYEVWFNKGTLTGPQIFIGSATEMGTFEAEKALWGSSTATIKYYVRFAVSKSGLASASWVECTEGESIPDWESTDKWGQWKAQFDRGDETDSGFIWNSPILKFVKFVWISGGQWTCKPTAVVFKDQLFLAMAKTDATYNSTGLIYDKNNQWLKDDAINRSAYCVADNELYGGESYWTIHPDVFHDEYGLHNNGHDIVCYWISRLENFGDGSVLKNLRRARLWQRSTTPTENDTTLLVQVSKDEGFFATIDTLTSVNASPPGSLGDTTLDCDHLWCASGNQGYFFKFRIYYAAPTYGQANTNKLDIAGLQIEAKPRTRWAGT